MKKELTINEVARLGGKARAKKLTKKRRIEIARMGGKAKKNRKKLEKTVQLTTKNLDSMVKQLSKQLQKSKNVNSVDYLLIPKE